MEKLNKFTKIFKKIYYEAFIESFKDKLAYNFPSNYFRWDLIEYLINKNNYSDYLEIGCDKDQLFSKIKIKNKIGVDPVSGGNVRKLVMISSKKITINLILFLLMVCTLMSK